MTRLITRTRSPILTRSRILAAAFTAAAITLSLSACSSTDKAAGPTGAATPSKLAFSAQPGGVQSGNVMAPVQVQLLDALGNVIAGATNNVTLSIVSGTGTAGAVLGGTVTVAAVNGVASFANLTMDKAGAGYILTASEAALTGATSTPFDVTAGAAKNLAFTVQPKIATTGAAFSPALVVTVKDAAGNTVTTATTNVTLALVSNPVGATLAGGLTAPAVGGVATFGNVSINSPGLGYTLTASAANLTGAASGSFNITTTTTTSTWATVSAGTFPTCGVTVSGAAYCWGDALDGDLGNGTTTSTTTPVAVSGTLTFASVSAGNNTTCGVTTDGTGYCWGSNGAGQLGNASTTTAFSTTPVAVLGGLRFASISSSGSGSTVCGLTTSHAAYCWGTNAAAFGNFIPRTTVISRSLLSGGLDVCLVKRRRL